MVFCDQHFKLFDASRANALGDSALLDISHYSPLAPGICTLSDPLKLQLIRNKDEKDALK